MKRVLQTPGHIARMQRREPAYRLQVPQASRSVLHIGFQMINRVLKFRAPRESENGKLPGYSLPALLKEGAKFLVEDVEQRCIARKPAAVRQADGQLRVVLLF